MRKRDELAVGCMAKAGDDEMTFVLLARDPDAPGTIRDWIDRRIESGKNKPGDAKLIEAEECARVMERERWVQSPVPGVPPMTLGELVAQSHAMAVEKGWWEGGISSRPMGDQFANFHAELSEAWEEYRAGRPLTEVYFEPGGKPCGFPIELADELIRLADTIGAYGIDIVSAVRAKMAYNATRPHRHGGKLA